MDTLHGPLESLIAVYEFLRQSGCPNSTIRQHRLVDPEDDGPPTYYVGIDTNEADVMSIDVIDGQVLLWDRRVPWGPNRLHSDRSTTIGELGDPAVFDKLLAEVKRRL